MEEFLLKLLGKRTTARVVCASGAILFFVAAMVFFLASYNLGIANKWQPRVWERYATYDPIYLERVLEAGMFYSLGLGLLFTVGFFWSLSPIPFPRLGWLKLLMVVTCIATGSYLLLVDEHATIWIIQKDYPLSKMAVGLLLILAAVLGGWLIKQRKKATREV
jgi:hypothetical protein